MDHGTRDEVLGRLAEAVESVSVVHPPRVAIDGPPAAGTTTLADELAVVLRRQGRDVIRERRVSSRADVERRRRERHVPSQQFYFAPVRATDHVDIIVHNDEPSSRSGRPEHTDRTQARRERIPH